MKHTRKTYTTIHKEITDLVIGHGVVDKLDVLLEEYKHTGYVVLCDKTTEKLYARKVVTSLKRLNVPIHTFVLSPGEMSKNMENVAKALAFMLKNNLDKKSAMVALGGGVIGDMATMIAALYHRGVDCIQIPTTLLSQVDSAHGGKGGVNSNVYKNMIGVTRQPSVIIVDPCFLDSLPKVQIRSGIGEIIKYAVAQDKELFEKLESLESIDHKLESIIATCIDLKMKTITQDPLDTRGIRVVLNFGHTLGHAIEITSHLTHGEAVAVGMTFAIKVSRLMNMISKHQTTRTLNLIQKSGLPQTVHGIDMQKVKEVMKKDKKNIGDTPRLVLLDDIGKVSIHENVPENIINKVLREVIV